MKGLLERDAQGTYILALDVVVDRGAQQGKLKLWKYEQQRWDTLWSA